MMFERAEKEEELWIRIDEQEDMRSFENREVYDTAREKKYCRVSIMTRTMLNYDRLMYGLLFEDNLNDARIEDSYAANMYRPYFYDFLIDIEELDRDSIQFLTNPENRNQWFFGKFDHGEKTEVGRLFPGYIERIASPVEYKDGKLEIFDKRLPAKIIADINNTYYLGANPCSCDAAVKSELDSILGKPDFISTRIYNIGNANCVYVKGKNSSGKVRLLYDIGYYCKKPSKNVKGTTHKRVVLAIRRLKPDCIILSHWDSDHFYGCAYADYGIFQRKWIAPNPEDAAVSAKRVAKYLQVLKKLILVKRSAGRQIAYIAGNYSELKVYLGEKRKGKDSRITKCNKEGIVLELVNQKGSVNVHSLMAGDVPYESLPYGVSFSGNTPYDYLIVPHHGAAMDTDLLSLKTGMQKGDAIICAKSGRPDDIHTEKLKDNGYTVTITGDTGFCIDIDLLQKKPPQKRP